MPNTKIASELQVDAPVELQLNYVLDPGDRRYLDSQIRGLMAHQVDLLIRGVQGTHYELDPDSPAVLTGDWGCLAGTGAGQLGLPNVTKALTEPMGTAGVVAGVFLQDAAPGGTVRLATSGVVPPSVTGLGIGDPGFVRLDPGTGRAEKVASLEAGDFPLGFVDGAGYLTIVRLSPGTGGGGGGGSSSGSAGWVQYANGLGGFSAESAFAYNSTTNALTVGRLILGGAFEGITLSGTTHNRALNDATTRIEFLNTTGGNVDLTGLQGLAHGRLLSVGSADNSTSPITLKHQDSGSTAGNRFRFGADLVLSPGDKVILIGDTSDPSNPRWELFAGRLTAGSEGASSDGPSGRVQLSDGADGFASDSALTYDSSSDRLSVGSLAVAGRQTVTLSSATTHDQAIADTASRVSFLNASGGTRSVTGLLDGTDQDGRVLFIGNDPSSTGDVILEDNDTGSSADNRFDFGDSGVLAPGHYAVICRDTSGGVGNKRWKLLVGGSPSASSEIVDDSTFGGETQSVATSIDDLAAAIDGKANASHTHTESDITDLNHTDPNAIHDNVSAEISAITQKTTPASGDWMILESVSNSNAKRRATVQSIVQSVAPQTHTHAHNDLTGLTTGDPHTMYSLVDGTRAFTGAVSGVDPTLPAHLATKAYVDAARAGLKLKDSVIALRDTNLGTRSGLAQSADGVSLNTIGMRVLLVNQNTPSQNGIWVVQSSAWTRPTDFPTGGSAAASFVFVEQGTNHADNGWVCTTNTGSDVIDTNNLAWTQFSGAGQVIPGAGMTKSGNTLNVGANADGSIIANADDIQVGVLATDAQHGQRGRGNLHTNATTSEAGFMSSADKQKVDVAVVGTQQVIAGTGMTGGGALGSGNVTLNVIGSSTIQANANSLEVIQGGIDHGSISGRDDDDHSAYILRETNGSVSDNRLARWDGTGGRNLQTSAADLSDSGALSGLASVEALSYYSVGTNPATDGFLRGPTNFTLQCRNAANNANRIALRWVSDVVGLGDAATVTEILGTQLEVSAPTTDFNGNSVVDLGYLRVQGNAPVIDIVDADGGVDGKRWRLDVGAVDDALRLTTRNDAGTVLETVMRFDRTGSDFNGVSFPSSIVTTNRTDEIGTRTDNLSSAVTNAFSLNETDVHVRLTSSANNNALAGITGGAQGRRVYVTNVDASDQIIISHEAGTATAANRIQCPSGVNIQVPPFGSVILFYDGVSSRWRAIR